jgi:hypothetical protein
MTGPMGGFKFGKPATTGRFTKDDHLEHLLCFVDREAADVATAHGDTTACRCGYVVCIDDETVDADVLIFGTALAPNLIEATDEVVVARLAKGNATPGRNPPWILEDASPADMKAAEKYFAEHASRMPSGRIVVEAPRPKPMPPAAPPPDDESF